MNIKKQSKATLLIESSQEDAKIESLFFNGSIVTKIIVPSKTVEISKPGDYEYSHIGFTGHEVTTENYKGIINLSKLVIEDLKVVVVFADLELNKEVVNELVNIDILITPYFSAARLKEHIADIDPKAVLILKDFESSVEVNLDDIKKTLGVTSVDEAGNYKFKNTDFGSDEEYTLSTYILK